MVKSTALTHVGVIVTRPIGQSRPLTALLESQGARVLSFPTLKITALDDPKLKQVVHDLDLFDHLIFTSVNAVAHGMVVLDDFWPQWPIRQAWYGIGNATAAALRTYGVDPVVPSVSHNSEGLLALQAFEKLDGQRICLFKGEAGRGLLPETLVQRGAELDVVNCYRRELEQKSVYELRQLAQFFQVPQSKYLIANSNESLDNFILLAQDSQLPWQDLVVVAASERIADHAKQSGFGKITQANDVGDKSLLEAIQEWCDNPRSDD